MGLMSVHHPADRISSAGFMAGFSFFLFVPSNDECSWPCVSEVSRFIRRCLVGRLRVTETCLLATRSAGSSCLVRFTVAESKEQSTAVIADVMQVSGHFSRFWLL
jgi:hypothetical protein